MSYLFRIGRENFAKHDLRLKRGCGWDDKSSVKPIWDTSLRLLMFEPETSTSWSLSVCCLTGTIMTSLWHYGGIYVPKPRVSGSKYFSTNTSTLMQLHGHPIQSWLLTNQPYLWPISLPIYAHDSTHGSPLRYLASKPNGSPGRGVTFIPILPPLFP